MKIKSLLIFVLFFFIRTVESQIKLSTYSEISIVTVGPGDIFFEKFGHSAIRIKDPVLQLDLIYNYGIFNFNTPNFELNFAKGYLYYNLGRYPFKYFKESYIQQKRWVKQQVLNLTHPQKQQFFIYLENNALPESSEYLYDPYYNNCATKLRDITVVILGDKVQFNDAHLTKNQSMRQLMDKELHWNTWGSFGINTALGNLDKAASPYEYMYLPDYVFSAFKNATVFAENQPKNFVLKEEIILDYKEKPQNISFFSPFLVFCLIALFGLFITYRDFKKQQRTKWLDFMLFFSTGFVGLALVFLWFFSSHTTAPNNFNILWAFAPNIFISFVLLKSKTPKWLKKYLLLLVFFLICIPIVWVTKIQQFPIAIIPFLGLIITRYLFLVKLLLQI